MAHCNDIPRTPHRSLSSTSRPGDAYDYGDVYAYASPSLSEYGGIGDINAHSPIPFPGNITRSSFSSPFSSGFGLADLELQYPLDPTSYSYSQASSTNASTSSATLVNTEYALRPFSTLNAASTLLDLAASPSPRRVMQRSSFSFSPSHVHPSPRHSLSTANSIWSPYLSPARIPGARSPYYSTLSSSQLGSQNGSQLQIYSNSQSTFFSSPGSGLLGTTSSQPLSSPIRFGFSGWDLRLPPSSPANVPLCGSSPLKHETSMDSYPLSRSKNSYGLVSDSSDEGHTHRKSRAYAGSDVRSNTHGLSPQYTGISCLTTPNDDIRGPGVRPRQKLPTVTSLDEQFTGPTALHENDKRQSASLVSAAAQTRRKAVCERKDRSPTSLHGPLGGTASARIVQENAVNAGSRSGSTVLIRARMDGLQQHPKYSASELMPVLPAATPNSYLYLAKKGERKSGDVLPHSSREVNGETLSIQSLSASDMAVRPTTKHLIDLESGIRPLRVRKPRDPPSTPHRAVRKSQNGVAPKDQVFLSSLLESSRAAASSPTPYSRSQLQGSESNLREAASIEGPSPNKNGVQDFFRGELPSLLAVMKSHSPSRAKVKSSFQFPFPSSNTVPTAGDLSPASPFSSPLSTLSSLETTPAKDSAVLALPSFYTTHAESRRRRTTTLKDGVCQVSPRVQVSNGPETRALPVPAPKLSIRARVQLENGTSANRKSLLSDARAYGRTPPKTRGQARVVINEQKADASLEMPKRRKRVRPASGEEGEGENAYDDSHTSTAQPNAKRIRQTEPAVPKCEEDDNDKHAVKDEGIDSEVIQGDNLDEYAFPKRTLPSSIRQHQGYSRWYRRFPVPVLGQSEQVKFTGSFAGASANTPRSPWDLYTPRFVKGRGTTKVGLCPICAEPHSRGGERTKVWLAMKFSAYKCYHMQYAHGVATSGIPFSPPVAFRTVFHTAISKYEKSRLEQGQCHKCKKWVTVEGVKDVEVKVPEIYWWKHAATCHQGSTIEGEYDLFIEDEAYYRTAGIDQHDST